MKTMKKIFYTSVVLSLAFTLLAAVTSCDNPMAGTPDGGQTFGNGKVIVRIAGSGESSGRTILPSAPKFSKYELSFRQGDAAPVTVENTTNIETNGVALDLYAGIWTITVKAYQDVFKPGEAVLAAVGSETITLNNGDSNRTVTIKLTPVPMKDAQAQGLFKYNFTLPQGAQAVLKLENDSGFIKEIDLTQNNSGSLPLDAGYYDMSVTLTKGGQKAGLFESVHIYSGLESAANIDLNDIEFVDKVYLKIKLDGVRLGTIQIADGAETVKEIDTENEDKAARDNVLITDISSAHIGKTVSVTQKFNGEETGVDFILESAGNDDVVLALIPANTESKNIAPWYSTRTSDGADALEFDYGFDVTVNAAQIPSDADGYTVEYWKDGAWKQAGDINGTGKTSCFFTPVTAQKFRFKGNAVNNNATAAEFGLYKTADRGALLSEISSANGYLNNTLVSADGGGLSTFDDWVPQSYYDAFSAAIAAACAVSDDPSRTLTEYTAAKTALNTAITAFTAPSVMRSGKPQLLSAEGSYHTVKLTWKEAPSADTYKIYNKYTDETNWVEAAAVAASDSNLKRDANNLSYTFNPTGYNNATKAGKEMLFKVEAVITASNANAETTEITARLIGPAELTPTASAATSATAITVTWNKVEGAGGYYVFRRMFNTANNAQDGTTIAYYVPDAASGSVIVTGKEIASGNADTTTTKAAASISDSKFTLTDSWMTDAEYSGTYSGYATYRDQQNDIAQGKAYRYFVVPVIANEPKSSIAYDGGASYTLKGVTVTNAGSLEKTGYTYGFGQNVTATKGSYVSSGNVNNGIEITWSAPPLLTGSPSYTLYRKGSNESTWSSVYTGTTAKHVDTTATRGIVYEYAVGVSGSTPGASSRFIANSRTPLDGKGIPKVYGYMLEMVKLASVSRNEVKAANGNFAENITLVKNADANYIKGIDGYTVYVRNNNINTDWHIIRESVAASDVDTTIQVAVGMGSKTLSTTAGNMTFDLLRVMRDYKHFFKVRSYVLNNGTKVYCEDPPYTYTWRNDTASYNADQSKDPFNTEYVKWGARQVTKQEFIIIAAAFADRGIADSWKSSASSSSNASTNMGGSGKVDQSYSYNGNTTAQRTYNFQNFKQDLQTRTGQWVTFVTIDGKIWSHCITIGQRAYRYGESGWVTVKGPLDTPDLYTGQVAFGANRGGGVGVNSGTNNGGLSYDGKGNTNTNTSTSNNGNDAKIAVKYPGTVANPGAAGEEQFTYKGSQTPLDYEAGTNRYQLEDYK